MTIPLMVFGGVLVLVLLPYFVLVARPENQDNRRLKKRLKADTQKRQRAALVKAPTRLSSVEGVDRLLGYATSVVDPLKALIDQSGLRLTVGRFVFATACAAAIPFLVVSTLTGRTVLGLLAAAACAVVPLAWVRRARTKRLWKFEEQFPEGIDLIARALRAGHTFPTGLLMVADEIPAPVGVEFRLLYDQQNFGMPLQEALRSLATRVPLLDAKFFATAVLTQKEAGGNLAEVLDNLSTVIRERFKVKRQVRVISAHGRITGWVLAGLPPTLAFVFMLVSPKHIQTLINDPIGVQMLIVAAVLQGVGTLAMRKIVNIEY